MNNLADYIDVFTTVPLATLLLIHIFFTYKLFYKIFTDLLNILKKQNKDDNKKG